VDGLIAAALLIGTCYEAAMTIDQTPVPVVVIGAEALAAVAFAWRRVHPVAVAVVIAAAWVVTWLVGPVPENLSSAVVMLGAGYATIVYATTVRRGLIGLGAIAVAIGAHGYADYQKSLMSAAVSLFYLAVMFSVGYSVRRHVERSAEFARRAALAEAARDRHAADAVARERERIARELHDVVAHAISVIVLHARGGRRMLTVEPDESRAAFDTVEEVAEQALGEMRRLLGLLRAADEARPADLAPQPSLRQLDVLIAQARPPGTTVDVRVEGDLARIPPSTDVTAYRIVQEALTNVRKHAAARTVRVAVTVADDAVDLEVRDDGVGGDPVTGHGFGLVGMRERVALFGGELTAGRRPEGGFVVSACLPLGAVPS
jgi:signal transduction histidine kinase